MPEIVLPVSAVELIKDSVIDGNDIRLQKARLRKQTVNQILKQLSGDTDITFKVNNKAFLMNIDSLGMAGMQAQDVKVYAENSAGDSTALVHDLAESSGSIGVYQPLSDEGNYVTFKFYNKYYKFVSLADDKLEIFKGDAADSLASEATFNAGQYYAMSATKDGILHRRLLRVGSAAVDIEEPAPTKQPTGPPVTNAPTAAPTGAPTYATAVTPLEPDALTNAPTEAAQQQVYEVKFELNIQVQDSFCPRSVVMSAALLGIQAALTAESVTVSDEDLESMIRVNTPSPPTVAPTAAPTEAPTDAPSSEPTGEPTVPPTDAPVVSPTDAPTLVSGGNGRRLMSAGANTFWFTITITNIANSATQSSIASAINTQGAAFITAFVAALAGNSVLLATGANQVSFNTANSANSNAIAFTPVTLSPTAAPTLQGTNNIVLTSIKLRSQIDSKKCGNGRLQTLDAQVHDEQDAQGNSMGLMCPELHSHIPIKPINSEELDVNYDANFGKLYTEKSDGTAHLVSQGTDYANPTSSDEQLDCETENNGPVRVAKVTTEAPFLKMSMYGNVEERYLNRQFDRNSLMPMVPDRINCCLYADHFLDAAGKLTHNRADAVRCVLKPSDKVEYVMLNNCYKCHTGVYDVNTNTNDANTATPWNQLGMRLDDSDENFKLHGHKCNYPATIDITKASVQDQSWAPVTQALSAVPDPQTAGFAAGMVDVCFKFKDPSWPAVHPQSNEFVAKTTRIQYEIICDPIDQVQAYPDPDNACEDQAAYSTDPEQQSFKCPRFAGRKNPCHSTQRVWELYSCDGDDCQSLENHAEDMVSQYTAPGTENDPDNRGVVYKFEHDSNPDMNVFQCSNKDFDNTALFAAADPADSSKKMHFGPSTGAEYHHICGNGGQSSECIDQRGEMIHEVNTCDYDPAELEWKENTALKKMVLLENGYWANLHTDLLPSGETYATCSAACHYQKSVKDSNGNLVKNSAGFFCHDTFLSGGTSTTPSLANPHPCEAWAKQRDLQEYHVNCGRTLKMRVRRDVNQQVMLRVKVSVYNTAVYSEDNDIGYMFLSQAMVPVSIKAKVNDIDTAQRFGFGNSNAGRSDTVVGSTHLYEKNELAQLIAKIGSGQDPDGKLFDNLKQQLTPAESAAWSSLSDQDFLNNANIGRFSRHARTYLEFIDCTKTKNELYSERNQNYPRFRISEKTLPDNSDKCFEHDYNYFKDFRDDAANKNDRLYSHRCNSHDAPTFLELRRHFPVLRARSADDYGKSTEWWETQGLIDTSSYGEVDSINEAYFTNEGLCMKTRLHVFEPSSCDHKHITSDEYNLNVVPTAKTIDNDGVNPDTKVEISSKQSRIEWDEDDSVELRLDVQHISVEDNGDSQTWFFGYIEIEDLTKSGAEFFAYKPTGAEDGPVGYEHTSAVSDGRSDTLDSVARIARVSDNDANDDYFKWRSYSHSGIAWMFEEEDKAGFDPAKYGGFSSPDYDTGFFSSSAATADERDAEKRHKSRVFARQQVCA